VIVEVHGRARYEGSKGKTIIERGPALTIQYDDTVIVAASAVMDNAAETAKPFRRPLH